MKQLRGEYLVYLDKMKVLEQEILEERSDSEGVRTDSEAFRRVGNEEGIEHQNIEQSKT